MHGKSACQESALQRLRSGELESPKAAAVQVGRTQLACHGGNMNFKYVAPC